MFNLCGSLIVLSVFYILSNYLTVNVAACKAVSFFLHVTLLVSCGAIAILLFFMIYVPYTAYAKRIAFTSAITLNLCKDTAIFVAL